MVKRKDTTLWYNLIRNKAKQGRRSCRIRQRNGDKDE